MTGATVRNGSGTLIGQSFNAGVTTVKFIVSDPDGNEDFCEFTVTIIPFNPPQFTAGCPPNIIAAPNDPGLCSANLTIPVPTVDDPCSIGYVITNDRTGNDNASGVYPVGTTEVIWTITPTVGNPTLCTQTITVTDEENPIITTCPETLDFDGCSTAAIAGPAFSTVLANSTYTEFSNATNKGVATDNCDIVAVTYIDEVIGGTCPIEVKRIWTVYDAAGNSANCNQTINIDENTPPIVACPTTGFVTPSEFDKGYIDYNIPAFDYSDNCTSTIDIKISWTITGPDVNGNTTTVTGTDLIPTPYRFYAGVSTISYVFTDDCGNYTECEFTITALSPPKSRVCRL